MKLQVFFNIPLQAVVSSLWQLTNRPVTGGGVPEESHAANRVSAVLSHENPAQEPSNALRVKKITKGSFWPTCLAASIWTYTVAHPLPADAPEALARAQLSDNVWSVTMSQSARVCDLPARLQNHNDWFLLESTKVYTLCLCCELGHRFQKEE